MTVKDLIEELEDFKSDSEVFFSYDYGDHAHTIVVSDINGVEKQNLIYSDYHQMLRIADREDSEEEPENISTGIVLI